MKRSTTLTAAQKKRVSLMRRKGWTPENIADLFDYNLESVKAYLHRRETAAQNPIIRSTGRPTRTRKI